MRAGMPWVLGALRACAAAGGRGVLFAHHRRVMDQAHAALLAGGWAVDRLDGETPPLVRARRLARFRAARADAAPRRVALVSVTAGGQGLDLSAARLAVRPPPRAGAGLCSQEFCAQSHVRRAWRRCFWSCRRTAGGCCRQRTASTARDRRAPARRPLPREGARPPLRPARPPARPPARAVARRPGSAALSAER